MALPLSVLPGMAYAADVATRNDAIAGMIVSERDYVSTWLTTLRNNWRMLGGQASMAFVTLLPGQEQLLGCDGAIVVEDTVTKQFKILLFEAKRIRPNMDVLKNHNHIAHTMVEYGVAASPSYHSHFSDQIARQAGFVAANPQVPVVEIFLSLNSPVAPFVPPVFDAYGSACVDHSAARDYVAPPAAVPPAAQILFNAAWNHLADLPIVCNVAPGRNLKSTLEDLVACRIGRPLTHPDGAVGILRELHPDVNQLIGQQVVQLPRVLQALGLSYFLHVTGAASGWGRN
ncbi:hypothetical protein [Burkholderia sp. D-99]|uniref:hypothetical protein n=1 Tax=Burkholderia sp. D-99 TaxID=2717316 RepID=UPI0014200176|nr:hypothetical protein [Burkholderia sp. D-99]NHV26513.1 hypothetical protein [Burkholderia sp. D-99]